MHWLLNIASSLAQKSHEQSRSSPGSVKPGSICCFFQSRIRPKPAIQVTVARLKATHEHKHMEKRSTSVVPWDQHDLYSCSEKYRGYPPTLYPQRAKRHCAFSTGPHGNLGGLSQGQNPHDISLAKVPALSQKEVSLS